MSLDGSASLRTAEEHLQSIAGFGYIIYGWQLAAKDRPVPDVTPHDIMLRGGLNV